MILKEDLISIVKNPKLNNVRKAYQLDPTPYLSDKNFYTIKQAKNISQLTEIINEIVGSNLPVPETTKDKIDYLNIGRALMAIGFSRFYDSITDPYVEEDLPTKIVEKEGVKYHLHGINHGLHFINRLKYPVNKHIKQSLNEFENDDSGVILEEGGLNDFFTTNFKQTGDSSLVELYGMKMIKSPFSFLMETYKFQKSKSPKKSSAEKLLNVVKLPYYICKLFKMGFIFLNNNSIVKYARKSTKDITAQKKFVKIYNGQREFHPLLKFEYAKIIDEYLGVNNQQVTIFRSLIQSDVIQLDSILNGYNDEHLLGGYGHQKDIKFFLENQDYKLEFVPKDYYKNREKGFEIAKRIKEVYDISPEVITGDEDNKSFFNKLSTSPEVLLEPNLLKSIELNQDGGIYFPDIKQTNKYLNDRREVFNYDKTILSPG